MNRIQPINLTPEQRQKLHELISALVSGISYVGFGDDGMTVIFQKEYTVYIHWMELCMRYVSAEVAELYAMSHINYTKSWAQRMILQKLAHDISKHNPIDTLYDIWKHPENYAQDL